MQHVPSKIFASRVTFLVKRVQKSRRRWVKYRQASDCGQARDRRPWLAMTQIAQLPTLLPTDSSAVYVVTGGNRGLGLEHVRQFLEKSDAHVVATTTKSPPSEAHNLKLLKDQGKGHRLTVVTLDLSKESSIKVGLKSQAVKPSKPAI